MKSHQIFALIISLCKKPQFLCLFSFLLAEQHILILWIVIPLEVFFEKSYLEPGSNSRMYWYPGLQNLFGFSSHKKLSSADSAALSSSSFSFGIFSPLLC